MDLQSLFYIMAIVFMLAWVILLVFAGLILWELYRVIKTAPERIEEKITALIEKSKAGIMGAVGVGIASFLLDKAKKLIRKKT